jgi:hypothetical protein
LYVHNVVRGDYTNFVSGASLTPVTGDSCVIVRFSTGSFSKYVTGSQVKKAVGLAGIYSASVSFYSSDPTVIYGTTSIKDVLAASGSITMDEVWTSLDESVTFFSSSLKVSSTSPSTKAGSVRKLRASMLSTPSTAQRGETLRVRAAFYDDYEQNRSSKFSFEPSPLEVSSCKLRVRDQSTGKLIFDFEDPGSKMSKDTLSNYYDLHTDSLPIGVPLSFEYQIATAGELLQITGKNFTLVLSE